MEILMKVKGIRILDKINRVVCVELPDILKEIQNGNFLHWSILYLYASGHLGEGKSIPTFIEQINESKRGFFINWKDLNSLANKLYEVIDILIIGCRDEKLLTRYQNDKQMYETCDIVIEMIDSGYWEIFSKNENLINRFARKFKEIKFLESDFEK
jgi:hypothetical protein